MRWFSLIVLTFFLGAPVATLNLSHDIAQYGHTAWTLREGALPGYPRAIAQTRDGYLWLATEFGLLRFDGVRFTSWQPPEGAALPSNNLVALLAGHDGSLWIGTASGLSRLKGGTVASYPDLDGQFVATLIQSRDGTVWAGTNAGRGSAKLCAIRVSGVECHGGDGTLGRFILSLYEDDASVLWVGASNGLWRWTGSTRVVFQVPGGAEIHAIEASSRRSPLIAVNRDVLELVGERFEPLRLQIGRDAKPTVMLRDRDAGLWIGTQDLGLIHIHNGIVRSFGRANGLSGDFVVSLLEDQEGDVWVGTLNGLDRFRDVAVAQLSVEQGLATDTVTAVQARSDGTVWLATVGGLNEWRDGRIIRHALRVPSGNDGIGSIFEDTRRRLWIASVGGLFYLGPGRDRVEPVRGVTTRYVHAIVEDHAGTVWISDLGQGLFRIREGGDVDLIPWSQLGGKDARALAPGAAGGLWLGFSQSGIAYFDNGRISRTLGTQDGLADGRVNSLHIDRDGVLWVATQGGLSRVGVDEVHTLRRSNGLPCDSVQWVIEDDERALWAHTACGLVRIARDEIGRWRNDPTTAVSLVVYDTADGVLRYSELGGYGPKVSKARDGRLWFATYDGVGIADPRRLPSNAVPPPVHIEHVTADRTRYDVSTTRELPALVRDLRFDYTALSLVAPDKIRFRYKLEGRDRDWVDAGDRRQAYYTDLPPGEYRFRVIAANNRGVWNEAGATWDFSIAPTFYQTTTFRLLSVLSILAAAYALYHLRVRRFAAQLNVRFEERLAERTRIAQELHDTLLQGFISSSMQLHMVAKQITDERVRPELTRILQRITDVISEGRQAVQGLRAPTPDPLERALARHGEYFRGTQPIDLHVAVRGERQPLRPVAYDTAYQIGREALANAFRHAQAARVEIDIEYTPDSLNLYVRDDGLGIDADIVASGRTGHWGLEHMRERADQIGAALRLWSRPGVGTEIELKIPRRVAFDAPPVRRWRRRVE